MITLVKTRQLAKLDATKPLHRATRSRIRRLDAQTQAWRKIYDLIAHSDCAPTRREDPGPALDLTALRMYCGFTRPRAKL